MSDNIGFSPRSETSRVKPGINNYQIVVSDEAQTATPMTFGESMARPGINSLKSRIYNLLNKDFHSKTGIIVNGFLISLVFLNIIAAIIGTVDALFEQYKVLFNTFETVSIVIFTFEYALRIITITEDPQFKHAVFGRLNYMRNPMMLVDLIAILPFYLPMLLPVDLRVVRVLRLVRLFRIFKLPRYLEKINVLCRAIKNKKEELLLSFMAMVFFLLIVSTLMYLIEQGGQNNSFSSIPVALRWGAETFAGTGCEDVKPITTMGKIFKALISLLGFSGFALPAGIICSGLVEEMGKKKANKKQRCPHCDEEIVSAD